MTAGLLWGEDRRHFVGICVGESDSEMRVIGNTGPGGAVQPSDLLQVLAVVVLLQREVQATAATVVMIISGIM